MWHLFAYVARIFREKLFLVCIPMIYSKDSVSALTQVNDLCGV